MTTEEEKRKEREGRDLFVTELAERTGLDKSDCREGYDLARHHFDEFLKKCSQSSELFSGQGEPEKFAAYTVSLSYLMDCKAEPMGVNAIGVAHLLGLIAKAKREGGGQ